jgi:glycosyltransferase involved in cell wall biosynthesis
VIDEYDTDPEKNSVVYNGTPWPAMPPRVLFGDLLHLGYHGRFVWFKRIDRFLDVAAKLAFLQPLKITLVGDGQLKDDLERQSVQLGLEVEFTGYRMDARELVRSFDVEIISSDEEYFGVAVLESIQAGHPTFVFADGGGCTEIFDERTSWFICSDMDEMAEKILSLRSPEVRERVLADMVHLQERIRTTFSRETLGAGYMAIYRQLTGGSDAPHIQRTLNVAEQSECAA